MTEPEIIQSIQDGTDLLKSRFDTLLAPLQFQELLDVAQNVCLMHPLEQAEVVVEQPTPEAALISQFGTRALKAAVELADGSSTYELFVDTDKEYEDERSRPIRLDTPLRTPTRFSTPLDYSSLQKAEQFGSQLINESFKILGQDAYEKAASFRIADTKDDQIKILQWLETRLSSIANTSVDPEGKKRTNDKENTHIDGNPYFFHPARLSPKLIGSYPNNVLSPTCLGVSIIATSFFKKAGADILHADVANREIEREQEDLLMYLYVMNELLDTKFNIKFPNAIEDSLSTIHTQTNSNLETEAAHHAAVYVKLVDSSWAQFDSNYYSTLALHDEDAIKFLDESHNTLRELSDIAPGLEIKNKMPSFMSLGSMAADILHYTDTSMLDTIKSAAQKEIASHDAESFSQRIFDTSIKPFFYDETDPTSYVSLIKKYFADTKIYIDDYRTIVNLLEQSYGRMFEKYVLWGDSPDETVKRMSVDKAFEQKRLEDIANLPFLILAYGVSISANTEGLYRPHSVIEVGLPEQRIGLAVLSDFAVYTDSPLPASFWTSHWPGSVSVMENLDGASQSSYEDSLLFNNVAHMADNSLTSIKNYSIINSFINIRNQPKEQIDDQR